MVSDRFVSDCCAADYLPDQGICGKCKEHCGPETPAIERKCKDCGVVMGQAGYSPWCGSCEQKMNDGHRSQDALEAIFNP
mgnify:CR=1 FL=1